jgi:hypothetical protein
MFLMVTGTDWIIKFFLDEDKAVVADLHSKPELNNILLVSHLSPKSELRNQHS